MSDYYSVVALDKFTFREVARFPSVRKAAEELGIRYGTIHVAICTRKPSFDCYWVYERNLKDWMPAHTAHKKVRGCKVPEKLKKLIEEAWKR